MPEMIRLAVFAAPSLLGCGAQDATSDAGADATTADAVVADSPLFGDVGPPPQCTTCSTDLHDVVACDGGAIITHCAADAGCAAGLGCVDPCVAAATDNSTTMGCDFYAGTVAPEYESRGSCYAAFLVNTWPSAATISASWGGTPLNVTQIARVPSGSGTSTTYSPLPGGVLPPGEVAILFLSSYPSGDSHPVACPVTPGVSQSTAVDGTGKGKSFHITTSVPVMAYDIYPYGGAASWVTSATLLLPTPAWGTNYVAVEAYAADPSLAPYGGYPYIQLYAKSTTKVAIVPPVDIAGGPGVSASSAGVTATYLLQAGEFLQLEQSAELTGALITSNLPVAVWGGTGCMHVPYGVTACDSGHQQLWPVSGLGSEYIAVRYGTRPTMPSEEVVPWRFVGAVDGTILSYDPPQSGAPTTLMASQSEEYDATGPFVVKSQDSSHPFYVAAYMTGGCACGNCLTNPVCAVGATGDPEFVNVLPTGVQLGSYTFMTDPTYATTELIFVRGLAGDNAYHDVALDCVGNIGGWQTVGSSPYEYTRIQLVSSGVPQGACDNGVHTAKSDSPFGLTVWGYDAWVSYAYPAGGSVKPINSVVVGPPAPN